MRFDYEKLETVLRTRERNSLSSAGLTPSGVTIPLFDRDGESHILFTLRTQKVKHHKGQISFPGGAAEEGDNTIIRTALRETFEEVGIPESEIRVLGLSDDMITISSFLVTPVVARLSWPFITKPSADEIEELIEIPVSALVAEGAPRVELWDWEGNSIKMYFYDYGRFTVWGATGRMLKHFLELALPCLV